VGGGGGRGHTGGRDGRGGEGGEGSGQRAPSKQGPNKKKGFASVPLPIRARLASMIPVRHRWVYVTTDTENVLRRRVFFSILPNGAKIAPTSTMCAAWTS